MKPLQAGKAQKSLDMQYRYSYGICTQKEHVYKLLSEGWTPDIEENYQYWSRKTGELTKPKTLYKLSDATGAYYEINKTLHNYCLYLINNNLLDHTTASAYIADEQKQIEELKQKENVEREQYFKERKEREEESKRQRELKRQQWYETGSKLMSDNIKNAITESILDHWDDIQKHYNNRTDQESLIKNTIETFTGQLGNESFIKGNVSYVFHDGKEINNINNKVYRSLYTRIFNVNETDSKQTLTAKVKAFYEGREYKGGNYKPKELEDFYILNGEKQFELRQGEKLTIDNLICFIAKNKDDKWSVTESQTGMSICLDTNKAEAIKKAKEGAKKNAERLEYIIRANINKFGLSPLYKEELTV